MYKVLLDGWVCKQVFIPGGERLNDEADAAIRNALIEHRLHISVLSYAYIRDAAHESVRDEIDKQMKNVVIEPLDERIVISSALIPSDRPMVRLIAATALCRNLQLIAKDETVSCPGLTVIGARKDK